MTPRNAIRTCSLVVFNLALIGLTGCFSVKAPDQINIGSGSSRPEPVDSRRIPPTTSHEHARQELAKAYQNIQYLERENEKLRRKIDEMKRDRD